MKFLKIISLMLVMIILCECVCPITASHAATDSNVITAIGNVIINLMYSLLKTITTFIGGSSSDNTAKTSSSSLVSRTNERQEMYTNNYKYGTGGALVGQCTWWCYCRASEYLGKRYVNMNTAGLAKTWVAGNLTYKVDKTPRANSILVVDNGTITGHVMYVESVSGNSITVSESNKGGKQYGQVNTYSMSKIKSYSSYNFIHLDEKK